MSGAFPSSPLPSSINLGSTWGTLMDMTQSGRRNVRQLGAHKWTINCSFPPTMNRDQFAPIWAFLMAQQGRFETFTFVSEDLKAPRGAAAGTPVVNGASQTGLSLITDGWTNNILQMKAGDIFKIVGDNKVYMVTADGTSDGSGNLTLAISPPLLSSPGDGVALTVSDVPFTMQLEEDRFEYSVSGPLLYQLGIRMIEVI